MVGLLAGWVAAVPVVEDVEALAALRQRHQAAIHGAAAPQMESAAAEVTGPDAVRWRHLLVRDETGTIQGSASVHDRASGRVLGSVTVDPELADEIADPLAAVLFGWVEQQAIDLGAERGAQSTQLDMGAYIGDHRQQRWLTAAGLTQVRTWWQMKRPVAPEEGEPGGLPEPKEGVLVRQVQGNADEMPDEDDLHEVHDILEAAFADHFNHHTEHFEEFLSRLRADPGHRWDHWWIAELVSTDADGSPAAEPAGALAGAVAPRPGAESDGSYVEYLGVLESARGRGVAKSLLHAIIADAARLHRTWVGLEVDADSPTGADKVYTRMGFVTTDTTQSWHRDLTVEGADTSS